MVIVRRKRGTRCGTGSCVSRAGAQRSRRIGVGVVEAPAAGGVRSDLRKWGPAATYGSGEGRRRSLVNLLGAEKPIPHDPLTQPPQHRSTAAPQPPQHRSTAAPQHRSTAAPQHRSTAAPQHRSTAAPQHRSTAAPPHRSPHLRNRRSPHLRNCPTYATTAAPQPPLTQLPHRRSTAAAPQPHRNRSTATAATAAAPPLLQIGCPLVQIHPVP